LIVLQLGHKSGSSARRALRSPGGRYQIDRLPPRGVPEPRVGVGFIPTTDDI